MEAPHLIAAGAVAEALRLEQPRIEAQPAAPVIDGRGAPRRPFVADAVQRTGGVVAVARGGGDACSDSLSLYPAAESEPDRISVCR